MRLAVTSKERRTMIFGALALAVFAIPVAGTSGPDAAEASPIQYVRAHEDPARIATQIPGAPRIATSQPAYPAIVVSNVKLPDVPRALSADFVPAMVDAPTGDAKKHPSPVPRSGNTPAPSGGDVFSSSMVVVAPVDGPSSPHPTPSPFHATPAKAGSIP